MRFRELPGFSPLFCDFVDGAASARPFFSAAPDAVSLRSLATSCLTRDLPRQELSDLLLKQAGRFESGAKALSNIARLRLPDAVVVTTTFRPGLFGGPLSCWMKALTAARLAEWLNGQGHPAVPLGWIDSGTGSADLSVGVLSRESPCRFNLDRAGGSPDGIPDQIEGLMERVARALEVKLEDSGVLQVLRAAYAPGTGSSLAWGRAISKLLASWGLILLDPLQPETGALAARILPSLDSSRLAAALNEQERRLSAAGYGRAPDGKPASIGDADPKGQGVLPPFVMQRLLLPVAAEVIDEEDAYDFARDQGIVPMLELSAPVPWPRVSGTIVDARSGKILSRYGLGLEDLFSGPQVVSDRLMARAAVRGTLERLESTKAAIAEIFEELAGLVPSQDRMRAEIESAHTRMSYQVEKLQARFSAAHQRRRDAVERQVERVCSRLAPWGRLQEKEFAGFQFLHQHSNALVETLYERADPWKFEHQLIVLQVLST